MNDAFERVPTSLPGLDELLFGGLPRGRATLVSGRSGTCKTVLALQVATRLAADGRRTVFASVEEAPKDLRQTGDSLDLATSKVEEQGRLRLVDFMHPGEGAMVVSGNFDITGLISRLVHLVEQNRAEVVIIDSISALLSPVPPSPFLRHQFYRLVRSLSDLGVTTLLTAEAAEDYGQIACLGIEDHVCDVVLILRNVIAGKRRRRSIEVHKYRRSGHLKGEYPLALTRRGLVIFPLDLGESTEVGKIERYSSGIDGLDTMLGGGWLRDSVVLLRGPTGSGKTLVAGTLAIAGARRGERVFYYGFEETYGMLVRNFEALGLPFSEYIDSNHLKVVARFPESTSPEDMIIELRSILTEYEPSLIVIDSISAIEHVVPYNVFRQFIIGITSALRKHGRSALLTQAVPESVHVDEAAPYLSTMADAVVQLGYEFGAGSGHGRSVQIIKMRGSAHEMAPKALRISERGIDVGAE